jgi:transcription factor IIIB 90 kDa subunit
MLIKRMKRDCIHTGRTPLGVCGAALLIAARFHNFERTREDILKIVKIGDMTLKRRLSKL